MLGLLSGFRWFENPRFMGAAAEQHGKWLQIDFMKRRYLWLAISRCVVGISIGPLAAKGLDLRSDFNAGKEPVVRGRGRGFGGDQYKSFQLRLRTLNGPQTSALKDAVAQQFDTTKIQIQTVSASFGRQIARGAIIAILFSLLLIILYIAIRF